MNAHKNAFPHVHYRWDVDKTYIHTDFDSIGALIRAWRQTPEEKRNIAGAPALLRELLASEQGHGKVTFISGSPKQMRDVLLKKFELDGIRPDNVILKPNLSNVLKLRLRDVHNQVGYKLQSLLASRLPDKSEYLFGDDSEQDALIYSLYGDLIQGIVAVDEFQELLTMAGLYPADVERIVRQYLDLETGRGFVERVFIHLDRRSPMTRFSSYGWRVVPVYNYFQAAIVLFDMGMLPDRALKHIVEAMRVADYTPSRLANSLQDLMRRGYVTRDLAERMRASLHGSLSGDSATAYLGPLDDAIAAMPSAPSPVVLSRETPDYRLLFESQRYRRQPQHLSGRDWLTNA